MLKRCAFCGLDLSFEKSASGKYIPVDYGTHNDHRESCPGLRKTSREATRDANHEQRVRQFLRRHR